MSEEKKGRGGGKLLLLLALLAGAGAFWRYDGWNKYVKPLLPAKLGGAATPEVPPVAPPRAGTGIRWTAKVIEVRRPVAQPPSLLVRYGEGTYRVDFSEDADAALRRLNRDDQVTFTGTLTEPDVVSNGKLVE